MEAASDVISATFVVVGGGIAGVSCVEQLSLLCPEESIVLVSSSDVVKAVTNLSKITQWLTTFDVVEESFQEFSTKNLNVKVIHADVERFNPLKREVSTSSGVKLLFKYLCLCHGARPKMIEGENEFVIGIRDTESVQELQSRLAGAHRIGIVGNGGIATELAYELKGVETIWMIRDDAVNGAFMDHVPGLFLSFELEKETSKTEESSSASVVKRAKYSSKTLSGLSKKEGKSCGGALGPDWHSGIEVKGLAENKLLHIEYECEVRKVLSRGEFLQIARDKQALLENDSGLNFSPTKAKDQWNVYVELTNGKTFGVDFIVSATGVQPNGDLIKVEEGCEDLILGKDGGIVVNEQMQSNLKYVYAAGDVCEVDWQSKPKHWFQMRLWTQARQMGQYVAQCMSTDFKSQGAEKQTLDFCFEMFSHVTKFFGMKAVFLGLFKAQGLTEGDYEVHFRMDKGNELVKIVAQDNRLIGAILIGETDLEETFENLILNQIDLSHIGRGVVELLDPNVDIEDYFD